uniref:Uncharacterized protein n=1 Tax=Amphimedon queenslandica TaxID=400682 RepID=A0A1X7SYK6_AMPQE
MKTLAKDERLDILLTLKATVRESDLRYLIENIWAGQSAVSGEKDLFELILVRWNITEHWSPWNCILLTTDEARAHVKLDDPEKLWEQLSK